VGDFKRDGVLLRAVEELQRLEPVVAGKMITGSGHHRKEQARAKVAGTGGPSSERPRRQHLLFFLRFSGGSGLRGAAGPVRTPYNTPLQLCGRNCGSSWACGAGPPNGLAAKPAPLASHCVFPSLVHWLPKGIPMWHQASLSILKPVASHPSKNNAIINRNAESTVDRRLSNLRSTEHAIPVYPFRVPPSSSHFLPFFSPQPPPVPLPLSTLSSR